MPKHERVSGNKKPDGRVNAQRIPDAARRTMLKRLGALAVAVPAASVLLSTKENTFAY